MLKTEHFFYIIEISKTGSINRAAENLFISQPYLSSTLREIEQDLGITVFKRSNKGVSLTVLGEKLLDYVKQVVAILDNIARIKLDYESIRRLNISSMYSFTILDIYDNFSRQKKYEHCVISYDETPNTTIPDKVMTGKSDIGIVFVRSPDLSAYEQDLSNKSLVFSKLCDERLCIIVSLNHPLANKHSVTIQELSPYQFIVEKHKASGKDTEKENNPFPEFFKAVQSKKISFDNSRSLMYYITKSDSCYGIGQKNLNLSNPFVLAEQLKYVPISNLSSTLITGYITNENATSFPILESFITYLEGFFDMYSQDGKICFELNL